MPGSTTEPSSTRAQHTALEPDAPPSELVTVEEESSSLESEGAIKAGKLAGRSMWAAIRVLAWPVLLQQTMQACVGLVDKMLAGRLPTEMVRPAMDAVGVGSYVGWLIGIAMTGIGIGGQALIARSMGSGQRHEAHHALGQSMSLSVAWGAFVGVALWLLVTPLSRMAGLSGPAEQFCRDYVFWIALSLPFCGVMMVGGMCLHGAGETAKPSWIAMWINIVNVLASWLFSGAVVHIGGFELVSPLGLNMHVAGIGLGTALCYVVGAILTMWVLLRGVKDLQLETRHMAFDPPMLVRIVKVGIPSFFEGLAMWGVNLFVLIFIGVIERREGIDGGLQGAHIIAVQWEALSFMPGFAIGTAAGALAGQYLGARNPRMAQKAILCCAALAAALMGLMGVLFMTHGEWLTRLISNDPVHLQKAPALLHICGTVQVFFAVTMVIRQGLRGMGDATWVLIITTVSSYLVRLPMAYIIGVVMGYGIEGIWFALCAELCFRACLFSARLWHGGWRTVRV